MQSSACMAIVSFMALLSGRLQHLAPLFVQAQVQQEHDQEEHARWLAEVDAAHQELLVAQKHRAALRDRLQQDAGRAKQEQLKRVGACHIATAALVHSCSVNAIPAMGIALPLPCMIDSPRLLSVLPHCPH
jgi:hypothetical protein